MCELQKAEQIGDVLIETLDFFGSRCEIIDIKIGPRTIKYSLETCIGTKVKDIPKLKDELQYQIGSRSMRILAPIPGRRALGIEIESPHAQVVSLSDFAVEPSNSPLTVPLGIGPEGDEKWLNIAEQPHLLVAGTTGSGKSSFLNSTICSLVSRFSPAELGLILVDTKQVELTQYKGLPHLITNVVTDARDTPGLFAGIVEIMEKRYDLLAEEGVRDITSLNEKSNEPLRHILVIVDEMADLMMLAKKDIEDSIVRIAQKARAVGIHLLLATQSPRKDVITGILKANLPSRIAFSTVSELDSRIVLDQQGAAQLLGNGDGLFSSQGRIAERFQAPLVTADEIKEIVNNNNSREMIVV